MDLSTCYESHGDLFSITVPDVCGTQWRWGQCTCKLFLFVLDLCSFILIYSFICFIVDGEALGTPYTYPILLSILIIIICCLIICAIIAIRLICCRDKGGEKGYEMT
jgi:hypothetical protein